MFRRRLQPLLILTLLVMGVSVFNWQAGYSVSGLNNRSIVISDSDVSQLTTYSFQFDIGLAGTLGSIRFEYCDNSPLPFTACNAPSGFDTSSAVISSQSGEIGFSVHGSTNANNMVLTRAPSALTPQTVSYTFSGVINPDTIGTYYVRIITYASTDGTGVSNEEGGVVFSTAELFSVTAYVPPFLQFCVGISILNNDCQTASGNLINFGLLSPSTTSTAVSQMTGATNGVGGLAISLIGTTMTSGVNTIAALVAPGVSLVGTSQFGLNLRANISPSVGINPTGIGTITPTVNYGLLNQFVFNNGDVIASSPISTNFNTLTASYLVNISSAQAPGVYTSTITYVATATF